MELGVGRVDCEGLSCTMVVGLSWFGFLGGGEKVVGFG